MMKRWWLSLVFILIIGLSGWFLLRGSVVPGPQLRVGEAVVQVEIRDTPEGRNLGLSGRQALGENEGMLFVFDRPDTYQFWMLKMNFDLDFIWINQDKVVEVSEHISAPDKLTNQPPMTVYPKQPVTQVLEVNSGWVEKNGIQIGDRVKML